MLLLLLACAGEPPADPIDTVVSDQDGDGVHVELDCDDQDASVWEHRELGQVITEATVDQVCLGACSLKVDGVRLEGAQSVESLSCLTHVRGDLELVDFGGRDLAGLERLEEVSGVLSLQSERLWNLGGLDALAYVGRLRLEGRGFRSLGGVPSLRQIGTLELLEAPGVYDFVGVEAVDRILVLEVNAVPTFAGLEGVSVYEVHAEGAPLTTLQGLKGSALQRVVISDAPELYTLGVIPSRHLYELSLTGTGLRDVQELRTLEEVAVSLRLEDNPELTDLSGLSKLSYAAELTLADLPALEHVDGLDSLREVGVLSLYRNDTLVDLEGLYGLESVGDLTIVNNPALSGDAIWALVEHIGQENISGELAVQGG